MLFPDEKAGLKFRKVPGDRHEIWARDDDGGEGRREGGGRGERERERKWARKYKNFLDSL